MSSDANGNDESNLAEDIERMRKAPYGEMLTDLELELCVRVPLFPAYYLEAKRVIIRFIETFFCQFLSVLMFFPFFREAFRTGMLTEDGVKRTLKVRTLNCDSVLSLCCIL
jgi:hypothetical protein